MYQRYLSIGLLTLILVGDVTVGQNTSDAKPQAQAPVVGRSIVATTLGIVAASQPLAAAAGVEILERGGNAVDAAIATNATLGLMEPTGTGIGGDLFVIYYDAKTSSVHGLNASGWAPTGLTVEFLNSKGITEMPQRGIYSVTVPGVVAGWDALRAKFGTKPFSELLAPAIYYAENGFPLSERIAEGWSRSVKRHQEHPNSRKTYLIDGQRAPQAGEVFRNVDLAGSLRLIAERGRDGYYKGRTAEAILQISREQGGTMTAADLAEFQPEWVETIRTNYRDWTIHELGPNTQGIAALMMLNIVEQFPLSEYGFHSTDTLHTMIEAKKLAYADMLKYVGDPRFSLIPVSQLLHKERAAARARLINPAKAVCKVSPAQLAGVTDSQGGDTIYLSVIDKDGNIVSLIQSDYDSFGSGLVPQGTGFSLQNRGALFTLEKGQANTLEPRKRPLHTIIPAFMEKGETKIGFGIMGGWNQAQAQAQFVSNIADFGMTIQQALEAGRFTKRTFDGCDVALEWLVPEATRNELRARGHEVLVIPPRSNMFGYGQAVMLGPKGVHFAASEPRHDGAAIPQAPPAFGLQSEIRKQTYIYKKVGHLDIRADVYRASAEGKRPVVVWIHGGALINGHREGIPSRVRDAVLQAGYILISIDYRLAPETQLPAIVEDVENALKWVREKGSELFGADPTKLAIMGSSAGGYLTLTAGFRVDPPPIALVSLWGYGDLVGSWYSEPSRHARHHKVIVSREAANEQVNAEPVSDARDRKGNGSLFYLYCRQTGSWPKAVSGWDPKTEAEKFAPFMPVKNVTRAYPPTLLLHGEDDTDVPYEQSLLMAAELKRNGVRYKLISVPGAEHGLEGGDQQQIDDAFDEVFAFLHEHLSKKGLR